MNTPSSSSTTTTTTPTPTPTSTASLLLNPSPPIRPSSAPPNFSPEGIQLNFFVECQARARIPSDVGEFYLHLYRNNHDQKEHLAITYGEDLRSQSLDAPRPGETEMDRIVRGAYVGRLHPEMSLSKCSTGNGPTPTFQNGVPFTLLPPSPASSPPPYPPRSNTNPNTPPLVRIHSECFTGETLGSRRCDCGEQLLEAMRMMRKEGRGVVVYLRQEGRGIGLLDKLRAYNLQDLGHDTVTANLMLAHPADGRTYGAASQILSDLGAKTVRLLTNNPDKLEQLQDLGISVTERVPMIPKAWRSQAGLNSPDLRREMAEVDGYLKAKVERMRHLLDLPLDLASAVIKADVVDRSSFSIEDPVIVSTDDTPFRKQSIPIKNVPI